MSTFNLITEKWIPTLSHGLVSLEEVFSNKEIVGIAGNPIEKISVYKLLFAIMQASYTPLTQEEWKEMSIGGLQTQVLVYLKIHQAEFDLFDQAKPFLQMPTVKAAKPIPLGGLLPYVATGNTTVLSHFNQERVLSSAEQALVLLTTMGFALGGKKMDNTVVLSPGYSKKKTGYPGPSLGFAGFAHFFVEGGFLLETLYWNWMTREEIVKANFKEIGIPPWESMPQGENDSVAQSLKETLMGRLIPLSRFCLLNGKNIHCTEGIVHPNYLAYVSDPSVAIWFNLTKSKAIWVNVEKKPWKELAALLGFFQNQKTDGFKCIQLQIAIEKMFLTSASSFHIWSGGLRVNSNAGEQFASYGCDFTSSKIQMEISWLGHHWFVHFQQQIELLDKISKELFKRVKGYYAELMQHDSPIANAASSLFFEKAGLLFQDLVIASNGSQEQRDTLISKLKKIARDIYNQSCPQETGRQMETWARNQLFFNFK